MVNRWYRVGYEEALQVELADGLKVRHLSAPHFLATKFEAFKDRGQNDVYLSHDLEDIMTVVEGRSTLVHEVAGAHDSVRQHVGKAVAGLLSNPEREQTVKMRLTRMAAEFTPDPS